MNAPTAVAGLIPIITSGISAILITDKFPPKINALIALLSIVLSSLICEWITLGSISGNKAEIFLGTLAYIGVFMKGDLGILYQSLLQINTNNPNAFLSHDHVS